MEKAPKEILKKLFQNVPVKDLYSNIMLTCKAFNNIGNDNIFMYEMFVKQFDLVQNEMCENDYQDIFELEVMTDYICIWKCGYYRLASEEEYEYVESYTCPHCIEDSHGLRDEGNKYWVNAFKDKYLSVRLLNIVGDVTFPGQGPAVENDPYFTTDVFIVVDDQQMRKPRGEIENIDAVDFFKPILTVDTAEFKFQELIDAIKSYLLAYDEAMASFPEDAEELINGEKQFNKLLMEFNRHTSYKGSAVRSSNPSALLEIFVMSSSASIVGVSTN